MIRSRHTAALAAAFASFATLAAPSAQAEDLLIRNATVHTGAAGAAPQTGTDILVKDSKIAEIGRAHV